MSLRIAMLDSDVKQLAPRISWFLVEAKASRMLSNQTPDGFEFNLIS